MKRTIVLVLLIALLSSCSPSAESISAEWTARQNELRGIINKIELLKGELPGAWMGDLLPEEGLSQLMSKGSRIQQNLSDRDKQLKEATSVQDKLTKLDYSKLSKEQKRLTDRLVEYLRLEKAGLDLERDFFNSLIAQESDQVLGEKFEAVLKNRQQQRDVTQGVIEVAEPQPVYEPSETNEEIETPEPASDMPQTNESEEPVAQEPVAEESAEVLSEAGYELNQMTQLFEPRAGRDPAAVLLTFDDVPMTEEAKESIAIAKTLKEQDIPAIFFVFGRYLDEDIGQQTIIELHDLGFTLGNHALTHQDLTQMSEDMIRHELKTVNDDIEALTGIRPQFFRPPFGLSNDTVDRIAREEGMLPMNWTYGYDWEKEYMSDSDALAGIMVDTPYLTHGANLLMHDRTVTAGAIGQIVEGLKAKGYSFIDPDDIELQGQGIHGIEDNRAADNE